MIENMELWLLAFWLTQAGISSSYVSEINSIIAYVRNTDLWDKTALFHNGNIHNGKIHFPGEMKV